MSLHWRTQSVDSTTAAGSALHHYINEILISHRSVYALPFVMMLSIFLALHNSVIEAPFISLLGRAACVLLYHNGVGTQQTLVSSPAL